ncbi:MAG: protein-L-isoaspartate(D-aspartate) O-methyltransferase [Candidatus Omnitrophota bacterium]|nr:MAG: protein-L-isoaspartate(D-aspartate) O-methyltransferase [Candidatus Omnitrophota bacterium]
MNYAALRNRMVEEQLIPRGISDERVLEAFRTVERHMFIPAESRDNAYEDHPLPIGEGQTISQPYMVALMTQCLDLKGNEKILEIGTGSGYQAAILAAIVKEVYSVERVELLAKRAESALKKLGYNNVKIKVGDGTLGWKEHAPYDGIIVTAAAPKIPDAYTEQLNMGGKLVIPMGTMFSQILTVAEKKTDGIQTRDMCGCVFVPLVGKDGWKE